MGVTRGWLPQRAGSPIPVSGGDAAVVSPECRLAVTVYCCYCRDTTCTCWCGFEGTCDDVTTQKLLSDLLQVFDEILLPTHASRYVQFIIFYVSSLGQVTAVFCTAVFASSAGIEWVQNYVPVPSFSYTEGLGESGLLCWLLSWFCHAEHSVPSVPWCCCLGDRKGIQLVKLLALKPVVWESRGNRLTRVFLESGC